MRAVQVAVAVAIAIALGGTDPAGAAGRSEDGPGANPACFRSAHEQPTAQPGDGPHFGDGLRPYLEDCRGEVRRP
jgi:hypothetical protein